LVNERAVLGQPLFTSWMNANKPSVAMSFLDLTNTESRVSFANLNETVFLILTPKTDLVV